MKLPEIVLPDSLPAWLVESFAGTDETAYAKVEMSTGHNRKRRVFRRPPVRRSVSMMLTEVQAMQFESWFENDLIAGERMFSARVRDMGPGHIWYPAQFVEPYQADYMHWAKGAGNDYWRISAELILYGVGEDQGPELTPFHAEVGIDLTGQAVGIGSARLSASISVPLTGRSAINTLSAEISVGLDGEVSAEGQIALSSGVFVPLAASATPTRTTLLSSSIQVALT